MPTSTHMSATRLQGYSKELGSQDSNPASLDQLAMEIAESTKRPPCLSRLEQLPLEILESIFLLSENVNLPKASAHIGSALASTHVRTELVLQAFGSNTKYYFNHAESDPASRSYEVEETPQNIDLQSTLLRQKWLSHAFFQHCQKTFMLQNAIQLYRANASGIPLSTQASTIADMTDVIDNTYDTNGRLFTQLRRYLPSLVPVESDIWFGWMGREGSNTFDWNAGNEIEQSMELSCEGCDMEFQHYEDWDTLGARDPLWDKQTWDKTFFQFPHLHLSCEVPEKLLHGPWTNERGHFLMVLLTHGASINWIDSTTGEVAAKGLEDAIREDNEWAVRALVVYKKPRNNVVYQPDLFELHFRSNRDKKYSDSEIEQMIAPNSKLRFTFDWCHQASAHRPGPRTSAGVVPSTKHLRIAVLERGCDLRVLKALVVEAEKTTIDCDDPDIINWALQKKAEADDRSGGSQSDDVDKGTALLKVLDDEREKQKRRLDENRDD
ncbi:hypothetical protein MMC30_006845 [Trapelia coarctata]|nr:hypothetical protein [Trapelia coarctata]